jgi:beta-galactosidase
MEANSSARHQRVSQLRRFLFGAAYYPEQWFAQDIEQDPQRMAEAGMNVVRMAEFAWDRMEPRFGEFDFSPFDAAISRLGRRGVDTILCTPTAAPPRWLTAQHEDWLRVNADGQRMAHGSRQYCCTNNLGFRAESERITRAMAAHYKDNPHVIGWQTDNEFHCHFSECYCPACVAGFREWLRRKYGVIDALNRAWGAAFWAQTYNDFEQVLLPYPKRPAAPNPSQQLDYVRFLSDSVCEFQCAQVKILRAVQPRWWITHNGLFEHIDYWKFAADLNFLGLDLYPCFAGEQPRNYSWASVKLEECRAASGSFIIPEQQAGAGGQHPYLPETPAPGQMRLWAWQAVAHGADGILHFRWRTARFGAEIYWNGILDHDNVPRRRYVEFSQEGAEFRCVGEKILGTALFIRAAVLVEHEQDEAHATMPQDLPEPNDQRKLIYRQMLMNHLAAGLVDAADSFDGLELIVVPSFVLMDEDLTARLTEFVEDGGVLVASARTATRDRDNHVIAQTPPGLLSELFGVTVEEFGALRSPNLNLTLGNGRTIPAGAAYELLKSLSATPLATWSTDNVTCSHVASGQPAITHNGFGKGTAIYIGTYFSENNAAALLSLALEHAAMDPLATADEFVEITCRHSKERKLIFILNHYARPKAISDLPSGLELLSGRQCDGKLELPSYGVAILET